MRYIQSAAAGRRGAHHLAPFTVRSRTGARLTAGVMWLLDPMLRPADRSDMVAFARPEDAFDLADRLGDIAAPTLVIAGELDEIYPTEVIRGTADGIRDGTLLMHPGAGHGATYAPAIRESTPVDPSEGQEPAGSAPRAASRRMYHGLDNPVARE